MKIVHHTETQLILEQETEWRLILTTSLVAGVSLAIGIALSLFAFTQIQSLQEISRWILFWIGLLLIGVLIGFLSIRILLTSGVGTLIQGHLRVVIDPATQTIHLTRQMIWGTRNSQYPLSEIRDIQLRVYRPEPPQSYVIYLILFSGDQVQLGGDGIRDDRLTVVNTIRQFLVSVGWKNLALEPGQSGSGTDDEA